MTVIEQVSLWRWIESSFYSRLGPTPFGLGNRPKGNCASIIGNCCPWGVRSYFRHEMGLPGLGALRTILNTTFLPRERARATVRLWTMLTLILRYAATFPENLNGKVLSFIILNMLIEYFSFSKTRHFSKKGNSSYDH